eukprot:FR743091.1.p1 GENE.FR743091.1~~FR743091.1.p1  ORF type:complete len:113 (+),score=18.68 FR743091.1:83-421(+)
MDKAFNLEVKEAGDVVQFHRAISSMLGDGPTMNSLLYAADLRNELQRFLSPNEWETLVLRYGLAQNAPHTVPEVAQLMDTNTAHTHRVLKGAFKKLHSDTIMDRLKPYMEEL